LPSGRKDGGSETGPQLGSFLMTSAYEIFARAEQVELAGAALYRRVADALPWAAQDRDLLLRLEAEEIQHAARVRLLSAQYRNDPRLFRLAPTCLAKLVEAEAAAEALAQEIDDGRWSDDLSGLKAHMADLEARWGASHADVLAECSDGNVSRFFRDLARQDHEHRAILLGDDAEHEREPAPARREVACRRQAG
jgi:hypothetical protein